MHVKRRGLHPCRGVRVSRCGHGDVLRRTGSNGAAAEDSGKGVCGDDCDAEVDVKAVYTCAYAAARRGDRGARPRRIGRSQRDGIGAHRGRSGNAAHRAVAVGVDVGFKRAFCIGKQHHEPHTHIADAAAAFHGCVRQRGAGRVDVHHTVIIEDGYAARIGAHLGVARGDRAVGNHAYERGACVGVADGSIRAVLRSTRDDPVVFGDDIDPAQEADCHVRILEIRFLYTREGRIYDVGGDVDERQADQRRLYARDRVARAVCSHADISAYVDRTAEARARALHHGEEASRAVRLLHSPVDESVIGSVVFVEILRVAKQIDRVVQHIVGAAAV
ncbi:hypothetical protein SDC9_125570 [bioreactor metagenome]|uniref:Uncharacterized protein n=1 Tax=bioreactor metagenome TaxID=1076179 RepID=A0A645CNT6_9ZZZZ